MRTIWACAMSHRGLVRENNEDNLLLCGAVKEEQSQEHWLGPVRPCPEGAVLAVCDGMGGMDSGEVASWLAVKRLQEKQPQDLPALVRCLGEANEIICHQVPGGGSTCVVALVDRDQVQVVNLGDSRGYLYRQGALEQLTVDHTVYQRKRQMGFTEEQLSRDPRAQHTLTQYLGILAHEMQIEPQVAPVVTLGEGDVLLLCSDGLSGLVSEAQMAQCLGQAIALEEKMQHLCALAMNQGGTDNITVILASYTQ